MASPAMSRITPLKRLKWNLSTRRRYDTVGDVGVAGAGVGVGVGVVEV